MNTNHAATRLVLGVSLMLAAGASDLLSAQTPAIPIACGELVAGQTTTPAGIVEYIFYGEARDRILVELERGTGDSFWNPRWDLFDGSGLFVTGGGTTFPAFFLPRSEFYRLHVADSGQNGSGSYRLRVDWLAPAVRQCGERLTSGNPVVAAAAFPFRKIYQFDGKVGDVVSIRLQSLNGGAGDPGVRFYDPHGIGPSQFVLGTPLALLASGRYTITVEDTGVTRDGSRGDHEAFELFLDRLFPREPTSGFLLGCGDTASGSLRNVADRDYYYFEGGAGDVVHFELVEDLDEGGYNWEVVADVYPPDSTTPLPTSAIIGAYGTYDGRGRNIRLPETGTYAVEVRGSGNLTSRGRYRLGFEWLAPAEKTCGPRLSCGIPYRASTHHALDRDHLFFEGEAGEVVDIVVETRSGHQEAGESVWHPTVRLFDPGLTQVLSSRGTQFVLPGTGRYFLEVSGGEITWGEYEVTLTWQAPAEKICNPSCSTVGDPCDDGQVEIVDLNDPVFRDQSIAPGTFWEGGREIVGMAVDGVTQVLLRAEGLQGPGSVTFSVLDDCESAAAGSVGALHDPLTGASGNPLTVPLVQVAGATEWKGFAVLTAPLNFARGDRDNAAAYRDLAVRVTGNGGTACAGDELLLVRPPVLLVHGLWGSGNTWEWRTLPTGNGARFLIDGRQLPEYVYLHDYRLSNAAHLIQNVRPLRRAIDSTLRTFRGLDAATDASVACTQVDLVAHSMGGVISRLYAADVDRNYYRSDNFLAGDIHKLLTLGTPHHGSPWADVVQAIVEVPGLGDAIANGLRKAGLCIDCGAVEDLQLDFLDTVPQARVPVHALYGTGATDYIQSGTSVPRSIFADEVTFTVETLSWFYRRSLLDLSIVLFGDEPHDMLVGESSARSGLGGPQVSQFGFIDGIHTYMQKSWRIEARVAELLNEPLDPTDPANPFAPLLPGGSSSLQFTAASPPPGGAPAPSFSFDVLEGAIQLVPAIPLTGLKAGDAVVVDIFPITGFIPDTVIVLGGDGLQILDHPPFQAVVRVPKDAIGTQVISAFAWGGSTLGVALDVAVTLNPFTDLDGLLVTPDPLFLFPYAPVVQLAVTAHYRDQALRQLEPDDAGLSFRSLNPAVATVDPRGNVTAQAEGGTTIEVTLKEPLGLVLVRTGVPVYVTLVPADDGRALAIRRDCGANPGGYSVSGSHGGRPVLGGTLALSLDLPRLGYSRGAILLSDAAGYDAFSGGQVLCVERASPRFMSLPLSVGATSRSILVPANMSLLGVRLYTQGIAFGRSLPSLPVFQLTNAWDFRVGAK